MVPTYEKRVYIVYIPGDTEPLKAISEFGAKPYTEDEKKKLSKIVKAFNERHGTNFSEADMIRFERANQESLTEDMTEMLRNNPPDVVYAAFRDAFFQGAIRMFQPTRCGTSCGQMRGGRQSHAAFLQPRTSGGP